MEVSDENTAQHVYATAAKTTTVIKAKQSLQGTNSDCGLSLLLESEKPDRWDFAANAS